MRDTIFSLLDNMETLAAIVVGAMLATLGALFAERIQDSRKKKQRQEDAANAIGIIITTILGSLHMFVRSRSFGDQWGTITDMYLQNGLRQMRWFEENRHRLFDLADVSFRREILAELLGLDFPLQGLIRARARMKEPDLTEEERLDIDVRRDQLVLIMKDRTARVEALLEPLGKISGQSFAVNREGLEKMSKDASAVTSAGIESDGQSQDQL